MIVALGESHARKPLLALALKALLEVVRSNQ
jgi:hypothetical protein